MIPFGSPSTPLNPITVVYPFVCVALLARTPTRHYSIILVAMQSAISVTISHQNEVIYSNAKTAQSMRDEGYQQPSLQTDIEPLPKLKEGELLYLSAAIEVWVGIAPLRVEDEGGGGAISLQPYRQEGGGGEDVQGAEGEEAKSVRSRIVRVSLDCLVFVSLQSVISPH